MKKLNKGTTEEKTAGFLSEIGVIAHVDHPNTAKLVGCCVEGEMHLVFELSKLGSLGTLLHGLYPVSCFFLRTCDNFVQILYNEQVKKIVRTLKLS